MSASNESGESLVTDFCLSIGNKNNPSLLALPCGKSITKQRTAAVGGPAGPILSDLNLGS